MKAALLPVVMLLASTVNCQPQYSIPLSGYPIQKKFLDQVYIPVWENLGKWNSYNSLSGNFEKVNSLALTRNGSIQLNL